MKKINTAPISGMQELLPNSVATFDKLKARIADVYKRHGFLSIETPIIDRCEILLAKAGGDTEKQIYKVVKTAETSEEADQALRFDHTVPLARYVVEHENDLIFPFKVSPKISKQAAIFHCVIIDFFCSFVKIFTKNCKRSPADACPCKTANC